MEKLIQQVASAIQNVWHIYIHGLLFFQVTAECFKSPQFNDVSLRLGKETYHGASEQWAAYHALHRTEYEFTEIPENLIFNKPVSSTYCHPVLSIFLGC